MNLLHNIIVIDVDMNGNIKMCNIINTFQIFVIIGFALLGWIFACAIGIDAIARVKQNKRENAKTIDWNE